MAANGIQGAGHGTGNMALVKTLLNRDDQNQAVQKEALLLKKSEESQQAVVDLLFETLGVGQNVDREA